MGSCRRTQGRCGAAKRGWMSKQLQGPLSGKTKAGRGQYHSWRSRYLPWHCRDVPFGGEVRDSSTVSAAGVLPSLQRSVLIPAMAFWKTSGQPASFYPCNREHGLARSSAQVDPFLPSPTHSHTITVVISWVQVHGHHWWRWAKDFLLL